MGKTIKKFLFVFIAAVVLSSCERKPSIIGTWEENHLNYAQGVKFSSAISNKTTYNKNGTFEDRISIRIDDAEVSATAYGKWHIKKDTLYLQTEETWMNGKKESDTKGEVRKQVIKELSKDKLVISISGEEHVHTRVQK